MWIVWIVQRRPGHSAGRCAHRRAPHGRVPRRDRHAALPQPRGGAGGGGLRVPAGRGGGGVRLRGARWATSSCAARCRSAKQAFAHYDDALAEGDGAFLLDQERPNVFTASVGNLRPGEAAELQIRYVALATREGDALRVAIPTTRFAALRAGRPSARWASPTASASIRSTGPGALRSRRFESRSTSSSLRRVESPSHPMRTTLRDGAASVELAQDEVALDRDFVLLVETADPRQPVARVAREADGRRVLMLTFLPENLRHRTGPRGALFARLLGLDGGRLDRASQARALACASARSAQHDTFNVVCFGSHASRALDDSAALRRREPRRSHRARGRHRGRPGRHGDSWRRSRRCSRRPAEAERPRRVLVLTDGQVSNEAEVIALARKHADKRAHLRVRHRRWRQRAPGARYARAPRVAPPR